MTSPFLRSGALALTATLLVLSAPTFAAAPEDEIVAEFESIG